MPALVLAPGHDAPLRETASTTAFYVPLVGNLTRQLAKNPRSSAQTPLATACAKAPVLDLPSAFLNWHYLPLRRSGTRTDPLDMMVEAEK
jgi:hypothetical protein